MIDKESIKARSENYAIDVNEYGPIEEAFSDGANWGIKQLQAENMDKYWETKNE